MDKVRVGIIGVGAIATIAHLASYAKRDDVEIVAFVDLETERVQAAAAEFAKETDRPVPNVYRTLEDMMGAETIDAVSICTPNTAHVGYALQALRHGIHVLVEKPLSTDLEEANQLLAAATATDTVVMVGMSHRYRTDVDVVKRFVDAGELGDIYYAKTRILRRRGTPKGWFTDQEISGGGPLMDIGVHALDLTWWLMGMPNIQSANGFLTQAIGNDRLDYQSTWAALSAGNANNEVYTTEDFAAAFLRFDNGSVLQLEVSWAINGPEDDGLKMELFGSKGGISLDPLEVYSKAHGVLTTTRIPRVGVGPLYDREIAHFLDCVKTKNQPLSDVRQGRDVVQMLEMIALSARESREVRVD